MMTRKNLRLLSYVRVSDVRGREGPAFISPEEQRDKCNHYASAFGHTIVDEGVELDRSGGDMNRPVFNSLLERIESGEADGLIVAKLNRFARSNIGAWNALERIKQAGGELLSVEENIDTSTATGRFLRDFMLIAANWERDRIGESWMSAKTRAVGRGIHVSRHVPPGYARLPKSNDPGTDRKLVPDPVHAKAVTEAFTMAARGDSYARVATFLTNKAVPNGAGATVWLPNRIKRLLANRVYLGEARYGEIVNDSAHEALVSSMTWNLAQRTPPGPTITTTATSLLAGLCRCANCMYAMRGQHARKKAVAIYRCQTNSVHGRCSGPSTISMNRIDDYVLAQFLSRAEGVFSKVEDDEEHTSMQAVVDAEQQYRDALTDVELRNKIGALDHNAMVAALHDAWQDALGAVPAPKRHTSLESVDIPALVEELQRREDTAGLRDLLASSIQAVIVRPAVSRARNLPIEDRVRIVWADEEPLNFPRRGERFDSRSYAW